MWEVEPNVPFPLLPFFDGVHFIRWLQKDPLPFLTKHTTFFFSYMDGVNQLTTRQESSIFKESEECRTPVPESRWREPEGFE